MIRVVWLLVFVTFVGLVYAMVVSVFVIWLFGLMNVVCSLRWFLWVSCWVGL